MFQWPTPAVLRSTCLTGKSEPVEWWGWLLLAWCGIAVTGGVVLSAGLRLAERQEWIRRGSVDRRSRSRETSIGR